MKTLLYISLLSFTSTLRSMADAKQPKSRHNKVVCESQSAPNSPVSKKYEHSLRDPLEPRSYNPPLFSDQISPLTTSLKEEKKELSISNLVSIVLVTAGLIALVKYISSQKEKPEQTQK
jgi:hypothetical protein